MNIIRDFKFYKVQDKFGCFKNYQLVLMVLILEPSFVTEQRAFTDFNFVELNKAKNKAKHRHEHLHDNSRERSSSGRTFYYSNAQQ